MFSTFLPAVRSPSGATINLCKIIKETAIRLSSLHIAALFPQASARAHTYFQDEERWDGVRWTDEQRNHASPFCPHRRSSLTQSTRRIDELSFPPPSRPPSLPHRAVQQSSKCEVRVAKDAARAQPQQPKHVGSFFAPLGSFFPFFFSSYGKLGIEKRAISAEGISDPVPSRPLSPCFPRSLGGVKCASLDVCLFVPSSHRSGG